VMEQGARWILFVAHWIAGLEGSVTAIPEPGPWVLPILTLGALWVILWQGRVRVAGLVPIALAFVLWLGADRPDLLISGDGKLLGLSGPEGRALSVARGGGFAAETWLENDGDLAGQKLASGRDGFSGPRGERWFDLAGVAAVSLTGKAAVGKLDSACAKAGLVILSDWAEAAPKGCALIDMKVLAGTGPLAVWTGTTGLRVERTRTATRLWSPPARRFILPDLSGKGASDRPAADQ
jgi:competence protein ComEC